MISAPLTYLICRLGIELEMDLKKIRCKDVDWISVVQDVVQ